jgi:uncharacterized protein with beta-barrel porin domain
LTPSTASRLAVTGVSSVDGTLLLSGSLARGQSYTILTAAGVSGAFSSVSDLALGNAAFKVTYGSDDIVIMAPSFLASAGVTANQRSVGQALDRAADSASANSGFSALVNAINNLPTAAQQQAALDEISGQIGPYFWVGGSSSMRAAMGAAQSRLGGGPGAESFTLMSDIGDVSEIKVADASNRYWGPDTSQMGDYTAWMQGFDEFQNVSSTEAGAGSSSSIGGGAFGVEWQPDHHDRAGFSFAASNDWISLDSAAQTGEQTAYAAGVYGNHEWDRFIADGTVMFGINRATSQRQIAVLNETANGATAGYGTGFDTGVGYKIDPDDEGDTVLTPRAGVSYTFTHENGYAETGAPGANLAVGAQNQSQFQTTLGATTSGKLFIASDDGSLDTIRPELRLGWRHDWIDPRALVGESFADVADTGFTARSASPGRDSALTGLGLPIRLPRPELWRFMSALMMELSRPTKPTAPSPPASNTVGRRALRAAVHSMTR